MKIKKRLIIVCIAALTLATVSVSAIAAAAYSNPAEATADITGKTVEEVITRRRSGTTYGTIAAEAGKLEEFKQIMWEIYKDTLDTRVADGRLTQEQADRLLAERIKCKSSCDGSGKGDGCGFGFGNSYGMGGRGMQNGSCMKR